MPSDLAVELRIRTVRYGKTKKSIAPSAKTTVQIRSSRRRRFVPMTRAIIARHVPDGRPKSDAGGAGGFTPSARRSSRAWRERRERRRPARFVSGSVRAGDAAHRQPHADGLQPLADGEPAPTAVSHA